MGGADGRDGAGGGSGWDASALVSRLRLSLLEYEVFRMFFEMGSGPGHCDDRACVS